MLFASSANRSVPEDSHPGRGVLAGKPPDPGDDQHEDDAEEERQPKPVPEDPEHRHEERRPGEAVLDEGEALGRSSGRA